MEEFERIARLQQRLQQAGRATATPAVQVKVGIGDDAAVLAFSPGTDTLVTTDTMVEGIHFLRHTLSWYDVGYKCLAASVSDIAAMGGVPATAVLSLAVPKNLNFSALEEMYDGIAALANEFGCVVSGGDLVSTNGPIVVTSTVLGCVPEGSALLRSAAQPGDTVFVTGELGMSAAGLEVLQATVNSGQHGAAPADAEQSSLIQWHRHPQPQVAAGQILRDSGVRCCNDISDGLASETNEIAKASQVRLRLYAQRVPMSPALRNFARWAGQDPLVYPLYGGEDYQLVGTASSFTFARALARCESVGVRLTAIGRVEAGDGVVLERENGSLEVVEARGYNHFSD